MVRLSSTSLVIASDRRCQPPSNHISAWRINTGEGVPGGRHRQTADEESVRLTRYELKETARSCLAADVSQAKRRLLKLTVLL